MRLPSTYSRALLFLWLVSSPFTLIAGNRVWTRTGPPNLIIRAMAVNPFNSRELLAATADLTTSPCAEGGVFRSMDGGWHWTPLMDEAPLHNIFALAYDPTDPSILYAAASQGYVLKSTDRGESWFITTPQRIAASIYDLAVDPDNGHVYAATSFNLQKSTDGGFTWSLCAPSHESYAAEILSLSILPTHPSTIYAGGLYRICRSRDGGITFDDIQHSLWTLVADPSSPNILYFARGSDTSWLNRSYDWGDSFESIQEEFPGSIQTLAVSPTSPNLLFMGTTKGFYRSFDGGLSWQEINLGYQNTAVMKIVIDQNSPNVIFAGTCGAGVFRSDDGGENWTSLNRGLRESCYVLDDVFGISCEVTRPGFVLATNHTGVFLSHDRGNHWKLVHINLRHAGNFMYDLIHHQDALHDPRNNTTYASMGNELLKSEDEGATWASLSYAERFILCLAVDPVDPEILYIGTDGTGIWKSPDGGYTWTPINSGLGNLSVWEIVADPNSPSTLYAGTDSGLYKSTDGGINWNYLRFLSLRVRSIAINPLNTRELYAGTTSWLFKSTDGGTSWQSTNVLGRYVTLDPTDPSHVYAGTYEQGMYQSLNGGQTWAAMNQGLTESNVIFLAFDPNPPKTVYAGTLDGVFAWSEIPAGDLNHDGSVDDTDLALLSAILSENGNFPEDVSQGEADLDQDGKVGSVDLSILRAQIHR